MLSDVGSNSVAMLGRSIVENPLYEIVAILIARDINQRDTGTVSAAFTNSVQVAAKKFCTTNLETLLNNLGGELVGTVLSGIANHMVNSSAAIGGAAVFTDVLNTPVTKLAMSDNVDVGENFFDTGTLLT